MTDTQPILDRYSVQEAAERLGVGATTIKTWATALGIEGDRNAAGKRYFNADEFRLLETVASLRAEDKGLDTITRVIGRPSVTRPIVDGQSTDGRPSGASPQESSIDIDALTQQVTSAVVTAIKADNELARDYAIAARQVGQLESQVANLQERLDEARRHLTDGQGEVETLKTQLAQETQARIKAEAERDTLKAYAAKPWWRRLLR